MFGQPFPLDTDTKLQTNTEVAGFLPVACHLRQAVQLHRLLTAKDLGADLRGRGCQTWS